MWLLREWFKKLEISALGGSNPLHTFLVSKLVSGFSHLRACLFLNLEGALYFFPDFRWGISKSVEISALLLTLPIQYPCISILVNWSENTSNISHIIIKSTNVYHRCDKMLDSLTAMTAWPLWWQFDYLKSWTSLTAWLPWLLYCHDILTAWLPWLLDCLDNLTALTAWMPWHMTAWMLWQLKCFDSLTALTA